jgi:hypothetical protein
MRLFAEEGNAPHVLAASGRRVWAAKVFVDAAAGLRKKSNLVAPFGDAAGATRAATWLKRAYSLQGDPKNSAAAPLRFDLALAVAYQEQPDLPSARPHLNDLIKQLSEKTVAFEGSERVLLLITHARCQDASTPLGQTAAIKSYAAAVEHIEKNKERVGIQDDIVYRSVVDPALRLVKKLPTPLKEASHEKPCAIVWASYANLLANNLDAYWDGLTKEKAMQAVVAAWDQACQIDPKNFNLLARRIEAYLAFVPMPNFETLANDARQLIGLDRQSSIGYYLLVKLLVKDLGANQHTDKKKARWLEVIQFADAGLAALDKEVNPPAERTNHFNEWRGAASNSLREILQTEGYALLRKRAYKEAVGLARELGSFDRIAAARIEGYVLHADKKWLDAQLVFGAALSEANEPANDWHLKLRQEYVNLLIAPGANEILLPRAKGSPEVSLGLIAGHISYWQFLVLAGQAEALVGIINDTVDPLSKGPAYGAAGAAWAHAEDMLPLACKVERKRASIKASAYLDQALTHTPTHKLGPIWLETYADVVNGLRLSDPMNIAVLEHCRKAAARLQEALKVGAPTPPPEDRRPRLNELLKKLSSAVK